MASTRKTEMLALICFVILPRLVIADGVELTFADFNNQGVFNNFSGDSGGFASGQARIAATFDPQVFRGVNGASLRVDYSVPSGFCGTWNSLLGKASFPEYSLNFTNLYDGLRNSAGNPTRVENVHVTSFGFWARGNGKGDFSHKLKVEFKSASQELLGSAVFEVPNGTNWAHFDFPLADLTNDVAHVKEAVFVIEDWRNDNRPSGTFYLDDISFTTDEPPYDPTKWSDDTMLDAVEQRAFGYFYRFTDSQGFALDRSTFSDMVSVGTIGFQLSAYCLGHERGWADRQDLENRVVTILQNLNKIPMGPEGGTRRGGYRGFYYHFLAANTGLRKDPRHVELSLYDTMLVMYGVLTCKEYFRSNDDIQTLSQQLFDRVEWDWFVDHAPGPHRNQFYLSWHPGPTPEGTFTGHVDGQTDEAFMTDVLALGSKTHPVDFSTYLARTRVFGAYPADSREQIMVTWKSSLFNYFFASCWLNFQSRGPDLHPESPEDIWQNDRRAILANRQFCIDHAAEKPGGDDDHFATYGENAWGLTACDNLVEPMPGLSGEYFSFGALPAEENIRFGTKATHAGTLAVYGAASAINFTPEESVAALRHDFEIPGLWSPLFGLGDAFSLDPHYLVAPYDAQGNPTIRYAAYLNGCWVNPMIMGINVGPMLLTIENYRTQFFWKLSAHNPEMAGGLNEIFGIKESALAPPVKNN
jgi:hypothetical protein